MNLAPPQVNREELLDLHRGTLPQVRRSLHDIRRINTYLGGASVVCNATMEMLQKHHLQSATVLDIGTGSADIPVRLLQLGQSRNIALQVLALDNNARHLQVAREDLNQQQLMSVTVHLLQADAFCLPLRDNAVDIVVSSLFLHHFRGPQVVQLLREFHRVSRVGWVMNDLVRHYVPLIFFRLTKPIFARSYITRHDGEASLRRGYTADEMQRIVREAPELRARVCEHFPYRMSIVGEKKSS
jgi:hypothetical protein